MSKNERFPPFYEGDRVCYLGNDTVNLKYGRDYSVIECKPTNLTDWDVVVKVHNGQYGNAKADSECFQLAD